MATYDSFTKTYTLTAAEVNFAVPADLANYRIIGNALDNILVGNRGNNTIDGGGGADTLRGGLGNDTYTVNSLDVVIDETAEEGNDTVESSVIYTLSGSSSVENLTLVGAVNIDGTGNTLANNLTGNSGSNILSGLDGDDNLNGGMGLDTLRGGAGDDTYQMFSDADVLEESAGQGTDKVFSLFSYTLPANIEQLFLSGSGLTGTGNVLDNFISGTAGDDTLNGLAGNDTLDGGFGVDSLIGGIGDDHYAVNDAADVVIESAGEGFDTITASASFSLGSDLSIEKLILSGTAVNGTGNALDNYISGNAEANHLVGGEGADTLDGGSAGRDTLVGGTGNDIYIRDDSSVFDVITEVAGEGIDTLYASVSSGGLAANVENLVMADVTTTTVLAGTANALDNRIDAGDGYHILSGMDGNDTIDGGAGNDEFYGGLGDDVFIIDSDGDWVVENAGEGNDTIRSSVTFTALDANVENLILTGTADLNGTGNGLANTIEGNEGSNVLDGGLGADVLKGGEGDDTYMVDEAGDAIVENAGEGDDVVKTSLNGYVLSANVEKLILLGISDIDGTGSATANTIEGNAGNNVLDGGGGADTLVGGLGNDTYVVDHVGDVVTEATGGGTDLVHAYATYGLALNLENLTLVGIGNINGTGNNLANAILGNAGNNVLDGGVGADTLTGGLGDDTYIVDSLSDVVIENGNGGNDTIIASVDHNLITANVENVILIGTGNVTLRGNEFANTLDGNAGNNIIDGGAGADIMRGAAGDDTYHVDNSADQVFEAVGGGTDTVLTLVSYALQASSAVEHLIATGTGALKLTGSIYANTITGNAAANDLRGGSGNDTLFGGSGNDTIYGDTGNDKVHGGLGKDVLFSGTGRDYVVFDTKLSRSANVDKVADFDVRYDTFLLDNKYFTKLGKGTPAKPVKLAAKMFWTGSAAHDADDRIIYNSKTGVLSYDADGTGKIAAVQFATIKAKLTYADFCVI
jgi:trimeric autotransporter adhesin